MRTRAALAPLLLLVTLVGLPTSTPAEAARTGPNLVPVLSSLPHDTSGTALVDNAVVVQNVGATASSGTVTVTGVTGVDGDGWTCRPEPFPDGSCTTEAVAAAYGSLPPLRFRRLGPRTLDTAYGGCPVSATVSGGGNELSFDDTVTLTQGVVPGTPVDLAVGVTRTDDGAQLGAADFAVQVTNLGAGIAAPPTVLVTAFVGQPATDQVTVGGTGWLCDGLRCTSLLPAVGGRPLPPLVVRVASGPSEDVTVTAGLVDNVDQLRLNDGARASTVVGPFVEAVVAPVVRTDTPVPVGGRLTGTVVVRNLGLLPTTTAAFVRVGTSFLAAGEGWTCADGGCTHPSLLLPGQALPPLQLLAAAPQDLFRAIPVISTVPTEAEVSASADGRSTVAGVDLTYGGLPWDLAPSVALDGPFRRGVVSPVRLTITNHGAGPAPGPVLVAVDDPFDGPIAGSGWACRALDDLCAHPGPVPPGGSLPELTLLTRPLADAQTNPLAHLRDVGATVLGPADEVPGNDTASLVQPMPLLAGPPALLLELVPDAAFLTPGGSTTVTLRALNRSADDVAAASLQLQPGPGLTVLPVGGDGVSCAGTACRVRPLVPGAEATLRLRASAAASARGSVALQIAGTPDLPTPGYTATGLALPVEGPQVLQERDLTATWAAVGDPRALGGSFRRERTAGASFTRTTTGSALRLHWVTGPDHGRARVLVDGRVRAELDQWAPSRGRASRALTGLGAGPHRVQVVVLGTKRTASRGTYATVDALSPGTGACGTGCDRSAAGTYAWRAASGLAQSSTPGASLSARVTGTRVDVLSVRGPSAGGFRLLVDGRLVATVPGRAATTGPVRTTRAGLAPGTHLVQVVAVGDGLAGVDRLEVR